jgi:hypothetical protein
MVDGNARRQLMHARVGHPTPKAPLCFNPAPELSI